MSYLNEYQHDSHDDEIKVTIFYKQKRREGETYNKSIPLNRPIPPNTVVTVTLKSKIKIDSSGHIGEIEVRIEIPCFREEVNDVYEQGYIMARDFINNEIDRLQYKSADDIIYK